MALIPIALYIILTCLTISANEDGGPKTVVVIKDSLEYNKEGIEVGRIRQFKRLVRHSNIFVDRTLLIKEILEKEAKVIFIITPRRYCRTTNLFMIKDFLDNAPLMKLENYRLFKFGEYFTTQGELKILENPLLIAQHEDIMNQYQGKHPVIYIHLDDIGGNSLDEIIKAFKYHIGDVYKEHLHLQSWLKQDMMNETHVSPADREKAGKNFERFNNFLRRKANVTELESSLGFLCELLYNRFGRRTFVLMDNYDGLLNSVLLRLYFTKAEQAKVERFFMRFVSETFQNKYIKKGIITGLFHTVKELSFLEVTDMNVCTILDAEIFQYFAFSKREVEELMHHVRIPYESQAEVHRWYNGYKSGKDYSYYHPWSVMKFLSTKVIQNNFEYSRQVQFFIKKFIRFSQLTDLIKVLVDGGNVTVPFNLLHFGKSTFLHLLKVADKPVTRSVYPEVISEFIGFLYSVGLVTFTDFPHEYSGTNRNVSMKIPNLEILQELTDEVTYLHNDELFE